MTENAFFKTDDNRLEVVAGMQIPAGWWSRKYEYAYCLQFAEPGQIVADMGAGRDYRPFKDAIAEICGFVYAVDKDPLNFSDRFQIPNLKYITADFTKGVPGIESASLDRIFCVSVLEDLGETVGAALKVFANLIKPDGLIVITMDSQYDMDKPLGQYPGVNMEGFIVAMAEAGLTFREMPSWDKWNALYHEGFNLTPFHCVLIKTNE